MSPTRGYGNTPSAGVLHRRLAALEGTEAALVLASGMAATACTMLALLRPGDHLVASTWLYGGTRRFFEQELPAMGIDGHVRRSDRDARLAPRDAAHDPRACSSSRRSTRPRASSTCARRACSRRSTGWRWWSTRPSRRRSTARPVEHGADVVIHSATKFLNGHHDVLAGVVCGAEAVIEEVRAKMAAWGQAPDPFALWLFERGLKTLDVRVQRQNAQRAAHRAMGRGAPSRRGRALSGPAVASRPRDRASRRWRDSAACWRSSSRGGADAAARLVSRLALFANAASLGGVESLVCEPRFTSHRHQSAEQRAAHGDSRRLRPPERRPRGRRRPDRPTLPSALES